MHIKVHVPSPLAARWRQRVVTLCQRLARQPQSVGRVHEFQDGFLLVASRSGKFITGNIIDFPQYLMFAARFPNANYGPIGEYAHQLVALPSRDALYPTLIEPIPFEPKKRNVSYGISPGGSVYTDEGIWWSAGPTVAAGPYLLSTEVRSRGNDYDTALWHVQPDIPLSIEARLMVGAISTANLETGDITEPGLRNTMGLIVNTDDLHSVAPDYYFVRYGNLNTAGKPPDIDLTGGQGSTPCGLVTGYGDGFVNTLLVAPTFKSTQPLDYVAEIPNRPPIGVTGMLFAITMSTIEDDELSSVTTLEHFSFLDHPVEAMRPIEGPVPPDPESPLVYWYSKATSMVAANYTGGTAVMSTHFTTNAEEDGEGFIDLVYSYCTMLSRVSGSTVTHSAAFDSSNQPAIGLDFVMCTAYTSGGAAYFHALRLSPTDSSGFDPKQPTSGEINQYNVELDIVEIVRYVVTAGGISESVQSCETLGWVPANSPWLNTGRFEYYYDNWNGNNPGIIATASRFSNVDWFITPAGYEQCAQLDEYRVAIPVTSYAIIFSGAMNPASRPSGVVIYDTRTDTYSAPFWFGFYIITVPVVVSKAVLDDEGVEVTPAILTVSLMPNQNFITNSTTLISYDSGVSWQTLVPDMAAPCGVFFVGNSFKVPTQGDPWDLQPPVEGE